MTQDFLDEKRFEMQLANISEFYMYSIQHCYTKRFCFVRCPSEKKWLLSLKRTKLTDLTDQNLIKGLNLGPFSNQKPLLFT